MCSLMTLVRLHCRPPHSGSRRQQLLNWKRRSQAVGCWGWRLLTRSRMWTSWRQDLEAQGILLRIFTKGPGGENWRWTSTGWAGDPQLRGMLVGGRVGCCLWLDERVNRGNGCWKGHEFTLIQSLLRRRHFYKLHTVHLNYPGGRFTLSTSSCVAVASAIFCCTVHLSLQYLCGRWVYIFFCMKWDVMCDTTACDSPTSSWELKK